MGALNSKGYEASTGRYVMLLNDDVIVRTRGWDEIIRGSFTEFPDGIALIHVNDTLMKTHLCTFPVVSRVFCELAGGICPREYVRYRIDDHIEDIFNLLAVLGERRTVYLPGVVFEHLNSIEHPQAGRVYMSDPAILAHDAPRFEALFNERKEIALRLMEVIDARSRTLAAMQRRRVLQDITDPFSLRFHGRQRIKFSTMAWTMSLIERVRACVRRRGYLGLILAIWRRLWRVLAFPLSSLTARG
jgi:hypothetical protein